jgi:ribosomal protein S18 acetylase RimI-like enzyme
VTRNATVKAIKPIEIARLGPGSELLAQRAVSDLKSSDSTLEHMVEFLGRNDHFFVIATEGGRPVGFLVAYELERVDGEGSMMFLYEVRVAESHASRGIGRSMIQHLKSICRDKKMQKMFSFSSKPSRSAMRLFKLTSGRGELEDDVSAVPDPDTLH